MQVRDYFIDSIVRNAVNFRRCPCRIPQHRSLSGAGREARELCRAACGGPHPGDLRPVLRRTD
jgi:hypothetical protein